MRCALLLVVGVGVVLGFSGCESLGGLGNRGEAEAPEAKITIRDGLRFSAPEATGWEPIAVPAGQTYVKSHESADTDEDIVMAFVDVSPLPGNVRSLEEVKALFGAQDDGTMEVLEHGQVLQVPVLRYVSKQEDEGSGSSEIRRRLQLSQRMGGVPYWVKSEGVFVLRKQQGQLQLVRVGMSRTSFHGLIGDHYRAIGESFVNDFILQNFTTQEG